MFSIEPVEQIYVKEIHLAAVLLFLKVPVTVFMRGHFIARQLVGQKKGAPGMALYQGFPDGPFAFSIQIGVGGVKIVLPVG